MSTTELRTQVRLLIPDNQSDQVYTDDEIDLFLSLEGSNVHMAAAQALDSMANQQALVFRHIEVMDVIVDAVSMAKELRYRSEVLRKQGAARMTVTSIGFDQVRGTDSAST